MFPLHSLAPIRFTGPDARSFLQGQLSNDLLALTPANSLLASCNSAQGRVQAVLRLIERDEGIVALLPRVMIDTTLTRLRKYVLRAKLSIEDARDSLQVFWAEPADLSDKEWQTPQAAGEHLQQDGISALSWPDARDARLLMLHAGTSQPQNQGADLDWQLADIRAGLPQILPETHESFVAQMLNLDVLNGISFNKGCYTGQEIIARAHFRGAVKRRMFRLQAQCPPPAPGTRLLVNGETAGEVVTAANTLTGCELLAVISLAHRDSPLVLDTCDAPLEILPLPYELPASS